MMLSTIEVLEKAAGLGIKLGIESPDTLTFQPVEKCPRDFAHTLRAYKPRLLSLLELPFVMVRSQAFDGEILFFCQDEQTKAALVAAGAEEWRIYKRDELQTLVAQNRIARLSQAELRKLHDIKKTFNARISPEACAP